MASLTNLAAVNSGVAASQWTEAVLDGLWRQQFQHQMHPFTTVLCIPGAVYRHFDAGAKRFVATKFMENVTDVDEVMFCVDGTGHDRVFLGSPTYFIQGNGVVISPVGSDPIWLMGPTPVPENAGLQQLEYAVMPPVEEASSATDSVAGAPSATASVAGAPSAAIEQVPQQSVAARNIEEPQAVEIQSPAVPPKIPRPPNAYILYRKERHRMVKQANPSVTNNEISQILGKAWNLESREVRFKYKQMAEKVKAALLDKYPDYQYRPRRPSERRRRARRNARTDAVEAPAQPEAMMPSPESISDA